MRFISSVICASDFVLSSARSHTTKILLVCKCVDVKPLGASLLSFSLSLCLSLFSSHFFLIWITTIFLICFTKYITNCRRLVQLSGSRWMVAASWTSLAVNGKTASVQRQTRELPPEKYNVKGLHINSYITVGRRSDSKDRRDTTLASTRIQKILRPRPQRTVSLSVELVIFPYIMLPQKIFSLFLKCKYLYKFMTLNITWFYFFFHYSLIS